MINLFEASTGNNLLPKSHNEDSYSYFNNSARTEIIEMRKEMEAWFSEYPEPDKKDLKYTFINDFDAGFFELFLFILFKKMGYAIKIHPSVPSSQKQPDFLISGHGEEFYLEAKVSYYESQEERSLAKRLGTLYDILDNADIADFFIYLRKVKVKSSKQPRAKEILHAITEYFNSFDVAELYHSMNSGVISTSLWKVYEDDDIYIEYGPIPKNEEGRGQKAQRVIGAYGFETKILKNVESLRRALKLKAGRYKALDKPYLIAINAIDMMGLDQNDVFDCLFGTTCIVPDQIGKSENTHEFRDHDGFFTGRNDQGQNTRVSAAFITKINVGNWKEAKYWITENQKARLPISLRNSSLTTRFIQDDIIYRTPGGTFGDIFLLS